MGSVQPIYSKLLQNFIVIGAKRVWGGDICCSESCRGWRSFSV